MSEMVLDECDHGVPTVNGIGCTICSNKRAGGKVFVKLTKGVRETRATKLLCSLADDLVDEVTNIIM